MNKLPRLIFRPIILIILLLTPVLKAEVDAIESLIEAKKFGEARTLIKQHLDKKPADEYLLYNLALTHYAEGDYDEAVVLWERVRMARDPDLVTKAMAQIGNASYRISTTMAENGRQEDATTQLRRAQHSLQAAVERDDDYEVGVKNYEYVTDKLVEHLIKQGNAKIEKSESKWVKGERDIVLFRSALTDYEEALSVKPDDEEIQKLVAETRKRMTDYLKNVGKKSFESAEKYLEKVPEEKETTFNQEELRNLQRAENSVDEAVANFEDAASISPDDPKTEEEVEKAREKASQLMQKIAEQYKENSEAYDERLENSQQRREEIKEQLKTEEDKSKRSELAKEDKKLSKDRWKLDRAYEQQQQKALDSFEDAVSLDQDNKEAQAALEKLQKKMSEEREAQADKHLAVAENIEESFESRQESIDKLQEKLEKTEDEKQQAKLEYEKQKLESYLASSAQRAADQLLSAKTELEEATQLDPGNESAEKKLEDTRAQLSDALEEAADRQLANADYLEEKGKEDEAIAMMEQAIKNLDSAVALSQSEQQQEALSQKMEAASQELLNQRGERAEQLAAQQQAMQQQQQQQQANQPMSPDQPTSENSQEVAMEYQEMVQFTETSGSEEFGNFDTKAMKKTVKDW